MALYIRTLKKQPTVLSEWNDTLWTVMVEKAIVHRMLIDKETRGREIRRKKPK